MKIVYLTQTLGLPKANLNELKIALTHISYDDTGKNNSRYAFLGQYESKATAARILYDFKEGTGMQLQHSLGNTLSMKVLGDKFDTWRLSEYIRHNNFEIDKHKHIFVFAILGFVSHNYKFEVFRDFIIREFIDDKILVEHSSLKFNKREALKLLIAQKYNKKLFIHIVKEENEFICTLKAGSNILSEHKSKSVEYAKRRAIEKAIKNIADQGTSNVKNFLMSKEMELKEKQRMEKEAQHEAFLKRQALKKQEREERILKNKLEKEALEKQRRKAKESVKKAKERKRESQIVITADMNAAKRRRLEDKMK